MKKLIKMTLIASALSMPLAAHADWSIFKVGAGLDPDINDSGQVVGTNGRTAFITGNDGKGIVKLDSLGAGFGSASGINETGQAVGTFRADDGKLHAFMTGPNGVGMTDLGTFGDTNSNGIAINDSGQVIIQTGFLQSGVPHSHFYISGPNGIGVTELKSQNPLVRDTNFHPVDINNAGQVTGHGYVNEQSGLVPHAFITGPNATGISDVGGRLSIYSTASAINESGQIAGLFHTKEGSTTSYAFVSGPNGSGITNLGTLGGLAANALDINDNGEVVGVSSTSSGIGHSFLFSHGGMTDLSILDAVVAAGWTDLKVAAINNNGQIVGTGHLGGNTADQIFILSYTPDTVFHPQPIFIPPSLIPEPETYAMLLAGLGLIGFMARRRKQCSALQSY